MSEVVSRRRFIGYLLAGPTLIAAVDLSGPRHADASVPTVQPVDEYDLSDLLTDAAMPTSNLIRVVVNADGTVSFALPRAEVGQGITTAVAMVIADEMDLPISKVKVTLADARPELLFNQLTGGSNTMHAIYTPVRTAAAIARAGLTRAAVAHLGGQASGYTVHDGVITQPGRPLGRRSRSWPSAPRSSARPAVGVALKPRSRADDRRHVRRAGSTPTTSSPAASSSRWTSRSPARCRRWSAGRRRSTPAREQILNHAAVRAMPGVTDVVLIPHTANVAGGVAVRAQTFGQCIDAIRALKVKLGPGLGRRQDRGLGAGRPQGGRAAADPGRPAGHRDRRDVHLLPAAGRSAGAQLRGGQRARRHGPRSGRA